MDADLLELEQMCQQPHVPVGRTACPDMPEHARIAARELPRAERGDRARAHVREPGRVDHGLRHAGARVVQRQQAVLRGQPELIVVDEVAHHLDAGEAERSDVAAQDVEVTAERLVGPQMHAGLDHGLAEPLRPQAALDGAQDLVVGQREPLDVGAVEVGQVELGHPGSMHPREK